MKKMFSHQTLKLILVLCGSGLLSGCALDMTAKTPDISRPGKAATWEQPDQLSPDLEQLASSRAFSSPRSQLMYQTLVAEMAGFRGDYAVSSEYFHTVAERTGDVNMAERATQVALLAKDDQQAMRATRLWVELAPDDPDARQILIALLLREARGEEALAQLDTLLNNLPEEISDQRLEMLLKLLRPREDQALALKLMDRIVKNRGDDPAILLLYAHFLRGAEEYDRALEVLERLLEMDPTHPEAVPLYVETLTRHNRLDQALDWLGRQLRRYPDQNTWREILARLLIRADREREAMEQFKVLLKRSPGNADALYALGLLSLNADDLGTARNYFMRLSRLKGDKQDAAYYFLGQIAEKRENYQTAMDWYGKVGEGAHYLTAQTRIAMLLAEQGQLEQGLTHLQTIRTDTRSDDLNLLVFEAELLIENKRYEQAMLLFDRGLQESPENISLLYTRALLGEKMGRLDILERDLRKILEIDPDNVDALNALGYTLADRTDRYQEALELVKKAYEQKPDAFYIRDSMGWVYYRLGRHDEALDYLRSAYALQKDPEVAAHLGEVLWVTGRKQEAREIWGEASELFPEDEVLREVMERFLGE